MILNATVLTNALEYSEDVGLRIANPYFEYYAVLSLLRAVVFTLPGHQWEEGKLMSITHSRAINVGFDWLRKFDRDTGLESKQVTRQLKANRELIAYRAPASGDANLEKNYDLRDLLVILAKTAQFNSELLQASVTKNAEPSTFVVEIGHMTQVAQFEIEGIHFIDPEDGHRLNYLRRKLPRPYNLAQTMTEGQTEDFIGAWDGEDGEFGNGPPANWQSIFDVP